MGLFDDILAEYGAPQTSISPVGQSLARGLMPQIGAAPPMTRAVPEAFQVMTPVEGPMMTPASFTELPAEQQSALTLESMMRQRAQRDLIRSAEEKVRQRDAIAAAALNLGDTAFFGLGTETAAGLESLLPSMNIGQGTLGGKSYSELIRDYGSAKEQLMETNPAASIAGTAGGAILPLLFTNPAAAAVQAGRTIPTLGEMLTFGTTAGELTRKARAAGSLVEEVPRLNQLGQLMKVGALQGGVQGAGSVEPTAEDSAAMGLLKRAIGGGVGAVTGAALPGVMSGLGAIPAAAKGAAKIPQKVVEFFNPLSKQEADAATGSIIKSLGVTSQQLDNAYTAAQQSDNPLLTSLTPAELLQNPQLATLEAVAEKSSGVGKQSFWDNTRRQISLAVQELKDVTKNISLDNPEEVIAAQDKTQRYIGMRMRELHTAGNKMYEDLPQGVEYARDDLKRSFSDLYKQLFAPGKGNVSKDIQYAFDFLTKRMYQEGGDLSRRMFGKADVSNPRITGQELIALRSGLLQTGRDLAEKNPEQARLANELGQVVHEFIQKDPNFGPKYAAANDFWSNLVDTFHSGQLQNISNKKIVSPENVSSLITSNVGSWRQWQKQTGYNLKLFQEQLATKFDEFAKTGADAENPLVAVNAKLKWIDDVGSKLVYGSPLDKKLADTFNNAKTTLGYVKEFLKSKKDAAELVAPGFTAKDIQNLSADELAQIALTANAKSGSVPAQAFKAAMRQFVRDKSRQALSRTLSGGALGLAIGAGSGAYAEGGFGLKSVIAGGIGAATLAGVGYGRGIAAARTAQVLSETLTAALRDPQRMKEVLNAATMAETKAATKAGQGAVPALASGPVGKVISNLTGRGAGVTAGAAANEITDMAKSPAPKKEETKPAGKFDDILAEYGTTPAPTPQPEKKASLLEKAGDVLVPPVQAEETKKSPSKGTRVTIPVGDKYVEPSLLRAIIKVESNYKANARSKAGALGPMQLMPRTAKALGVDPNDVHQNIEGGSRYMQQLINRFNDTNLGLMAYNWGEGNVAKALRWLQGRSKPATFNNIIRYSNSMPFKVPRESREYVYKINTAWDYYKSRG